MKIIVFSNKFNAEKYRNDLRRKGWHSVSVGHFNYRLEKEGEPAICLEIVTPMIVGHGLFKFLNSAAAEEYRAEGIEIDVADVLRGIDNLKEEVMKCADL